MWPRCVAVAGRETRCCSRLRETVMDIAGAAGRQSEAAAAPFESDELVAAVQSGEHRAVARLISLVENADPRAPELVAAIARHAGRAHVIGVTGAGGVGKSTAVAQLVTAYRRQGLRVGVLAVDPSSPFSGGALLGDRVRMQTHASDAEVFIRSMSSRGSLGGLAVATPQAVRVLEAAGCGVILIETVGVGQAEVEIAAAADTTVLLLAPGLGDGVQAAKAGIIEIADVFAVNKADQSGAQAVVRDLRGVLAAGGAHSAPGAWRPRIVSISATQGVGIDELISGIAEHEGWLERQGEYERRRRDRAAAQIVSLVLNRAREAAASAENHERLHELARAVVAGEMGVGQAADQLWRKLHD